MKITLTRPLGGNDKGDTIDVPAEIASRLIVRGAAEKPKISRKSTAETE